MPVTLQVNPTSITLKNVSAEYGELISSKFSFDVPGAYFAMKKHKEKHPEKQSWCNFCKWDGKRCLYEDGRLPLGFLSRLKSILTEAGVEFEVTDNRPPKPEKQYEWHFTADHRDYQQSVVQNMLSNGSGVVQAATGGGKTVMCADIVCRLGLPAIVVVPTKNLLGQFIEAFEKFTDIPVGWIGDGKYKEGPVQIATAASLVTKEPVHPDVLSKDVICIDEMHHSSAATWERILSNCPAYHRFGFSATPKKDSELEQNLLIGMCGDVITEVSVEQLQASGHLAKSDIRVVRVKCGYDRMIYDETEDAKGRVKGWRETHYAEKYRKAITENQYGNEVIARIIKHHADLEEKVLVIISQIDHAELLMSMLDHEVIFIRGGVSLKRIDEQRTQFQEMQGGICIGTSVADEGLDVPAIDVLVLVAGGDLDTKAIQRIGRGLRPSPGKDTVVVYDIRYDDKPMFWYHGKSRIDAYKKIGQAVTEYDSFDEVLRAEAKQKKLKAGQAVSTVESVAAALSKELTLGV